ncbi:amino acid adenylation domain-containing protein [Streptomyces sp. NBC_01317]|uniref:amino acid adenylation domain-containing protein n=1 Tax=Streptomyces sp. NBC_01317 TaxID=2903822 RepID=UPI002E1434FA|nr:amino acid adenylation domain-containing protein [Streptomyces sp. NBC_01317]
MLPDPRWTAGRPGATPGEGLHETFARTARARPDAVALAGAARPNMTYGELDRTADAWAARLMAAGVGPGSLVPVLLPRGPELVVALLAVLKAGAAYAPLDPDWPARRLREAMADLEAPLVVARSAAGTPDGHGLPVWTPPTGPVAAPPGFRPAEVAGSDAACVFFTSGTTGRPKGVVTPHRATVRLFAPDTFAHFGAGTVTPLAAPPPWDAFSLELWSALLNGGRSVVVEEPYLSPAALRDGVSVHGTDTVWLTSSLFNMITDEDPAAFEGVRQVMIGGERLSTAHVRRFLLRHPGIVLLNGYGPVESTVFATTHRITPADCDLPGGIPLGRPVPGTGVHVLDGTRVCAVGETGEICVAGEGLALRYLGDPALTEAAFTRVTIDGETLRVYRTGDLGVWGADGLLHFRGRADRQVKIRGHRVEPAEVERQVERCLPAVRTCRVLARKDAAGTAQELVAFCVPAEPGDRLEGAAAALAEVLVSYQRPSRVVAVDALPLTARGKLDERALLGMASAGPAIGPGSDVGGGDAVGSGDLADPAVRAVAETFAAVLGRANVPLDTPFVALGGTSLGAGRVCARLAARLHRPVPVATLYERPTVAALAHWLRTTPPPDDLPEAPPETGDTPLTPLQTVYLTRQLLAPSDLTAHCVLAWLVEGDLDTAALETAVAETHRRHESLSAAYVLDPAPYALLVDAPPPLVEILPRENTVDSAVSAARAALSGELEPEQGELWRTVLAPVAGGRASVFGVVVHHIAFDGWSESVLARDLAAAYNAAKGGGRTAEPAPPSLAVIHQDRARYRRQTASAAHEDYVRGELTGVPDLRWPAGPPDRATGGPGRVDAPLSSAVLAGVDDLAREAGVTRFAVLLSNWAAALAEVTGRRDFAVGVPVAQRDGARLDGVVGCHIGMLCLRLRGAALGGGTDAVREASRITARALAAQDVSLGDILSLTGRPRTGRPPLYQVLFALQDNAVPRLELAGVRTDFLRQPYLDLPLELHTELWPDERGGLRVEVSFRPEAVAETTAQEIAKRFTDRLRSLSPGVV